MAPATKAMPGALCSLTFKTKEVPSVIERDVLIPMPGGHCDAALFSPGAGPCPGVLLWTDALGLRPAKRAMARRLAEAGYTVLVPNPYYRLGTAPFFDPATFSFSNPEMREKVMGMVGTLYAPGVAESDAAAYVAFLDAQPETDTRRRMGVQGYCMGGRLSVITASVAADRIGAVASFHGGGLITDKPDSPHLLLPGTRARYYLGVAADDHAAEPHAAGALREAFAAAGLTAEVEVYASALHGWCVPDMPPRSEQAVYHQADAEHAWAKLLALYASALGRE